MIKTRDYDKFQLLPFNRDIDESHVTKLVNIIKKDNKLEKEPILVTKNLEVIDGQHRLEAAKRLGVDVYYQVEHDFETEDLLTKNMRRRNWTILDIAKFWSARGKNDYTVFINTVEEYKVSPSIFVTLISPTYKETEVSREKFMTGTWKMPHEKETLDQILRDFSRFIKFSKENVYLKDKRYLDNRKFHRCLISFLVEGGDVERMIKNLTRKPSLFKIYHCIEDINNMLKSIENYRAARQLVENLEE